MSAARACATSPATTSASPRRAPRARCSTRTVQTGFDPETGRPIFEERAARPQAAALHRRGHRRDGRPDDGRRQGDRGRRAAPGADGARRRHPCHHGHPAPLGRRHHRHHQGQLPDPHLLPGHLARSTAAPSWASRAPSSCWARATCSTWPAAAASPACTAPSSRDERGRGVVRLPARPGRAALRRRGHRRPDGRGRRRRPALSGDAAASDGERRASTTRPSRWSRASARPAPASSSATCRSATTAPPADRAHGAGGRRQRRQPCRQARSADPGQQRRGIVSATALARPRLPHTTQTASVWISGLL